MAPRKGKGRGRQAVRNSKGGFPVWGYILIGIVIGVILVTLLMRGTLLPKLRKQDGPQANPQATAQPASDAGVAAQADQPKKPKYDFYSVLSEKDVRIPDDQISAMARAEQQKQQAAQQQQARQQQAAQQAAAQQQAAAHTPPAVSQNITAAPASSLRAPAADSGYLLQVGAFPNASDAETLKAKLALQGFVANVQSVDINGQTYHRVRLGPFGSATALESTKQRLSAAGIHAIALKEGK